MDVDDVGVSGDDVDSGIEDDVVGVVAADDDDGDDDELVALVAIARALDEICDEDCDPPAEDALKADCARNAARKFARNGRFVDILDDGCEYEGDCGSDCGCGIQDLCRSLRGARLLGCSLWSIKGS